MSYYVARDIISNFSNALTLKTRMVVISTGKKVIHNTIRSTKLSCQHYNIYTTKKTRNRYHKHKKHTI